ncbi:MAG: hypothetical protein IM585_22065 [Pseudanabaena sp. M135S2SP2A07QC]|jgi:hypothetical protein|nr:hypothetical protein [Pseudanabaena sp. M090S1SP2A07QC]MCA6506426.1 hypothetical protein [Pseudanabaena sp. M172S2SP2A07QC]MCA6523208.1 hypothetical protein [Pseudanabaena sp. M051S1SP2A07QC]MCA6526479.1 hypothetical protein [Pseudanabaena sp. M179S2SP2A07QC]MCA6530829.1 hypothetical protein [Pseudanabaena sp. M125S2SP2A07QC]MCA6533738.1 hypothetical protein [Pseudanabaena sp. M176S2SP2A07QC]MCA6538568.1 hypothetical protein [Pseudanabaena sp. M037S2SP2A07QC]MCA6548245.1 hypothetical prot
MKVSIKDSEVLKRINPLDVSTYLAYKSWQLVNEIPNRASIWTYTDSTNNNEFEILLPLNPQFKDFPTRISEIISTLEVVESQTQTSILEKLQNVFSNIINLRLTDRDFHDGTIPINKGVDLHKNAKSLILSAACSSVESRPFFERIKPDQATKYLQKVRLGQPKIGSYILTIISPLNKPKDDSPQGAEQSSVSQQFSNIVVVKLRDSLQFTKNYIEYVIEESETIQASEEIVNNGVTANLCEALTAINSSGNNQGIEINFNWSPVVNEALSQSAIKFEPSILQRIEELGEKLRAYSSPDYQLTGNVIKLQRKFSEDIGTVTVQAVIEGKTRNVQVHLYDVWYLRASQAHATKHSITCRGDLRRDGQSYILDNVTSFSD